MNTQPTIEDIVVTYVAFHELVPRLYYLLDQAMSATLDKAAAIEAGRLLPAGYANSFATKAKP